ncbi:MAG: hypothetical protein HGB21_09810 [Nitrospirae bacterium]|nr:hypothetical protein [Nitrospirota bacterium]NTW66583.1 hypothetical protein [Nitrospirota bacterium]
MEAKKTGTEELAFKTAELDTALADAGFLLAYADPEASRDLGYRARYIRGKSTLFPLLNASLEYYIASRSFSLKISASDERENKVYYFLAKNYRGDIKGLLDRYFDSVRKGLPLTL